MRILFMTNRYPPHYEGNYELRCKEMAEGLGTLGHHVLVLTTRYGVPKREVSADIYRLLHCSWSGEKDSNTSAFARKIFQYFKSRSNGRIAEQVIRQFQPDLVFVWQLWDITLRPLLPVIKRRLPYVFQVGDYSLIELKEYYSAKHGYFKKLWRWIKTGIWDIAKLDFAHCIFVSEAVEQKYKNAGLVSSNGIVIPCALGDPSHGKKRRNQGAGKAVRVLYAGRVEREKGVHVAIQAVLSLKKQRIAQTVRLDIVGEGNAAYGDELRQIVKKNALQSRVRFLGKMAREALLEKYGDYDLLVVPSLWEEPFGVVVLEAMRSHVPVIASNIGGIPGIIQDRFSGLLVPPDDHQAIADAIAELMKDQALYRKIQRNGADTLKRQFDPETILAKVNQYLMDVHHEALRRA